MTQRNLIRTLTALEPKTKAARVREVMPVIEQKIAAGVRITDILQALNRGSIDLTAATLKSYLYRYRHKQDPATRPARPSAQRSYVTRPVNISPPHQAHQSASDHSDPSERTDARAPISMQELDRLMKPDAAEQAEKLAHYERLAKQQRRSRK